MRERKKYGDKRERDFNEICIAIIIFHARDQGKRTGGGVRWIYYSEALFKTRAMKHFFFFIETDKRKVVEWENDSYEKVQSYFSML